MGITDWARATRKRLVPCVSWEEGNGARLKLRDTWRQKWVVVILAHGAVR